MKNIFAQKEAIAKLLRDDDPRTVGLVKDQLTLQGTAALPSLHDLLTMYDERVTEHIKDVMGRIDAEESIRVPLSEERLLIDKDTVLREEYKVGKREVTQNQSVSDNVRRERLLIDDAQAQRNE